MMANHVREVSVVEVIRVVAVAGKGNYSDPVREITSYWGKDGIPLVSVDPHGKSPLDAPQHALELNQADFTDKAYERILALITQVREEARL